MSSIILAALRGGLPVSKTLCYTHSMAGRPTDYKPEYAEQAEKLCSVMGATDIQLADFFGVSESTLNLWKLKHPNFSESLKTGKDTVDKNVERSLYRRAMGYEHETVKIFCDAKTGEVTQVPYREIVPPDTTACIFWLKNRKKADWRDKHEVEVGVTEGLADVIAKARERAKE